MGMRFFIERLLQFLLPPQCPCCKKFLDEGQQRVCADCLSQIRRIQPPFCSVCGTPFVSKEVGSHLCGGCVAGEKYFTTARALGFYEGFLQEAIRQWKYESKTHLTPFLGEWMAEGLARYWDSEHFDLLLPVPLHLHRLRERGFNQALLLVKELNRRTGIPYQKRALRKRRATIPQVHLSGADREKAVKGAFHVAGKEALEEKTILLVDDVYTTGATVNECSRVLLAAGAKRVDVLTLAHAVRTT